MSEGWQPGDLALCVNDGPPRRYGVYKEARAKWIEALRKGRIYRVTEVVTGAIPGHIGLFDDEAQAGGHCDRFRKIRPHTPDAEDAETIRLLNGQPATPEPVEWR